MWLLVQFPIFMEFQRPFLFRFQGNESEWQTILEFQKFLFHKNILVFRFPHAIHIDNSTHVVQFMVKRLYQLIGICPYRWQVHICSTC